MHTFPFCITIAVLVADSLKSAKCFMFNLVNKIVNTEQRLTLNIMEHVVYILQCHSFMYM